MSSRPIQYKLVYNRKNRLNKNGEALIQIEAYKDGERVYFSTGIYVTPEQWDAAKERVVKHRDNHKLNNRLIQVIEGYKAIELDQNRTNTSFTPQDLKKTVEKPDNLSFIDFALDYLSKEKNLSKGTYTKYLNSINGLKEYCNGDVKFSELNYALADGFRLHLVEKGIGANTQKIYFRHLAKYARLAISHELLDYNKNPFPQVKIKSEKPIRYALDETEIAKIENLKFTAKEKHLEIIRDMFLFSCYTGLRFSDVSRMAPEHIHETKEGLELRMKAEKNSKAIDLPLYLLHTVTGKPSKPEQLIHKYTRDNNLPYFLSLKPQQSKAANNQYTNRELKEIQRKAKVKTKLTNHVGRHTFATFLVWRLPLPIVQQLLQHSKIETTMVYIHVGSDKVKEHLRKIIDW